MPRIYTASPLASGQSLVLDGAGTRHVQVLRLQPGASITLFNGMGGEFQASIGRISKSAVEVVVGAHDSVEREDPRAVHLAISMPANERMDWLVEKASELGVASIAPLMSERSVLRLTPERAHKKQLHWRGCAVAACEQCGRNRIPLIHPPMAYQEWIESVAKIESNASNFIANKVILSLQENAMAASSWTRRLPRDAPVLCLSGPEGGFTQSEYAAAQRAGFTALSLGLRTLRAETAPIAALTLWTLADTLRDKAH